MTTERFIIFLLLCGLAWMYFYGPPQQPDVQRSSQPFIRSTAAYSIDTSAPATVIYLTPAWPTVAPAIEIATPTPTGTAVPQPLSGTPEPQRGSDRTRGCASTRSCGP